jgi:hypothetical protein
VVCPLYSVGLNTSPLVATLFFVLAFVFESPAPRRAWKSVRNTPEAYLEGRMGGRRFFILKIAMSANIWNVLLFFAREYYIAKGFTVPETNCF